MEKKEKKSLVMLKLVQYKSDLGLWSHKDQSLNGSSATRILGNLLHFSKS